MEVVEIRGGFGLDRLAPTERDEPRPRAGQVLLRMSAASLNYRDLLMVRGQYNPKQPLPLIPCSDGVGEVVAIGDDVDRVKIGERVAPIFAQRWLAGELTEAAMRSTLGGPLDGTLAELVALDAEGVTPVPSHLTDEEAAALPCAGVTAWSALVSHGAVTAGQTVLIQGTGGVSIFALQFARLLGARPIVLSSSDAKLERARTLGAWKTLNYASHPEWGREVSKLSEGPGVDIVIDVGGAATLGQSMRAVRPGGSICSIGVLSGHTMEWSITPLLMRQVRLQGIFVGPREAFEAMNRAIGAHELRPQIDRTFPLEQARNALEHLAGGQHFGKICLRIG